MRFFVQCNFPSVFDVDVKYKLCSSDVKYAEGYEQFEILLCTLTNINPLRRLIWRK